MCRTVTVFVSLDWVCTAGYRPPGLQTQVAAGAALAQTVPLIPACPCAEPPFVLSPPNSSDLPWQGLAGHMYGILQWAWRH